MLKVITFLIGIIFLLVPRQVFLAVDLGQFVLDRVLIPKHQVALDVCKQLEKHSEEVGAAQDEDKNLSYSQHEGCFKNAVDFSQVLLLAIGGFWIVLD